MVRNRLHTYLEPEETVAGIVERGGEVFELGPQYLHFGDLVAAKCGVIALQLCFFVEHLVLGDYLCAMLHVNQQPAHLLMHGMCTTIVTLQARERTFFDLGRSGFHIPCHEQSVKAVPLKERSTRKVVRGPLPMLIHHMVFSLKPVTPSPYMYPTKEPPMLTMVSNQHEIATICPRCRTGMVSGMMADEGGPARLPPVLPTRNETNNSAKRHELKCARPGQSGATASGYSALPHSCVHLATKPGAQHTTPRVMRASVHATDVQTQAVVRSAEQGGTVVLDGVERNHAANRPKDAADQHKWPPPS